MKKRLKEFLQDESGMGVIEVVLIILVLVGLALVFKNQIARWQTVYISPFGIRLMHFKYEKRKYNNFFESGAGQRIITC